MGHYDGCREGYCPACECTLEQCRRDGCRARFRARFGNPNKGMQVAAAQAKKDTAFANEVLRKRVKPRADPPLHAKVSEGPAPARNPFNDQRLFMVACGQTVDQHNSGQAQLYAHLIDEEYAEFKDAVGLTPRVDGALDLIYVCIGYLHSLGLDPQPLWDEVQRSNEAKIDPTTGKVLKRPSDGKILKPAGWTPPDLEKLVFEQRLWRWIRFLRR